MLNVLQIFKFYHPHVGGIEKVIQALSEGLADVCSRVLVCQPRGKGSSEKVNGVPVVRAGTLGTYFSVPLAPHFPMLLKQLAGSMDLLHFHLPFPLADVSYLLAKPQGKVVVWWHSDIVRPKHLANLYRPLLVRFLKKAEAIIVAAPQLIESSRTLRPFSDKCEVIPIGIDLARFATSPDQQKTIDAIRARYGPRIVLFVGRLAYYKGIDHLLRAMQQVDGKLLLIGEGPLEESLRRLAALTGVEDRCLFLGRVPDKELTDYYHACDIFVLPSIAVTEAYGIVQLEAMACGKPVVSTRLPTGVTFVNLHGETGLTVTPGDAAALAGAINQLLDDPGKRLAYGNFAKTRVEREFTREVMVTKVYNLYRRVAG